MKTGNYVHRAKSRTRFYSKYRVSGAFLSKIIWWIIPHTVKRFSVLLAPNSKSTYIVIIQLLLHTLYIVWLQELGPEVIKVFILPHISSLAQKIDIGTRPLSPHILHSEHSTGTYLSKNWICAGILEQSNGG